MSNKMALDALKFAEAALADIGDADREPGDDLAWCEARAAEALPRTRAAIAALQAAPQGWMPIETAPKDGTTVLVFPASWSNYTASMARWNRDEHAKKPRPYWERSDCFSKVTLSREKPPTHWMPLPATPPKD